MPVPTQRTKGVLVIPTITENLLVGPTAEDVSERDEATVTDVSMRYLKTQASRIVPALGKKQVCTRCFVFLTVISGGE